MRIPLSKRSFIDVAAILFFALPLLSINPSLAQSASPGDWGLDQDPSGPLPTPVAVGKTLDHNYHHDDGVSDVQIGVNDGGHVMMINAFTVEPGQEWITHICPAWGLPGFNSVDIGHPYRVILYEDPNDDGDPNDAVYLTEAPAEVTVAHLDIFEDVPILPTRVEGGFFIAALYPNQLPGLFPFAIDETNPQNHSWIAAELEQDEFNVYDLNNMVISLTGSPFDGNLLLRAVGVDNSRYVDVRVTQITDGAPAVGAEVTLTRHGGFQETTTTDHFGLARFADLEPGWYSAYAVRNGLASSVGWGYLGTDNAALISLGLPTQTSIKGLVIDDLNGINIAGANVELALSADPSNVVATTETDADGYFIFDVATPGTFVVKAWKTADVEDQTNVIIYHPQMSDDIAATEPETAYTLEDPIRLQTNVVVMLHGIKASSRLWSDDDSGMASTVRDAQWVVVDDIDLSGCVEFLPQFVPELGGNLCGLDSVEDQILGIQSRLEALPVESFHVVSHSQGGLVARWYAERITRSVPRIDKLITIGTPHHGSQLAYLEEGIYLLMGYAALASISAQNPVLADLAVGGIQWWQEFNSDHQALAGLKPNSDTLRNLNRGSTAYADWEPATCLVDPYSEAYLVSDTQYHSLRGTGGWLSSPLSAYIAGAAVLRLFPMFCIGNDGIVPTKSAYLWQQADNVNNYSDLGIGAFPSHHKDNFYAEALVANEQVQSWVLQVLSDTYVPTTTGEPLAPPERVEDSWSRLTGFSFALDPDEVVTDSVHVDATDSLVFNWMWVTEEPDLTLTSPSGAVIDSAAAAADPAMTWVRDPVTQSGRFEMLSPETGNWAWNVAAASAPGKKMVLGSVRAHDVPGASIQVIPLENNQYAGRRVEVMVASESGPVLDATVDLGVVHPSGLTDFLVTHDDGIDPDLVADDGIYSAQLAVEQVPGITEVAYTVAATTPVPLERRGATTILIGPQTDIAILGPELHAYNSSWRVGDTLDLGATVANLGVNEADVYVEIISVDEGQRLYEDTLTLSGGSEVDVQVTTLAQVEGDRTYAILVRPLGGITDEDWLNNTASTTVEIGPAAAGVIDGSGQNQPGQQGVGAARIALQSVYPNPFNPTVEVSFRLDAAGKVSASVYDIQGRVVRRLLGTVFSAGDHRFLWDGRGDGGNPVASGIYFLQLETANQKIVRKMALIK